MTAVIVIAAVLSGLMAGIFFAFSTFVMKALRTLPPAQGMAAMQAINVAAVEPPLMVALFGTALFSLIVGVDAVTDLGAAAAWWALAGAALNLLGVLAVTAAFHVPRNNALAAVAADDPDAADAWARYAVVWTAGNHVRTIAPLAAAVVFTIAVGLS